MGKTQIPESFSISESMRAWAARKVPSVDIDREHEAFVDYWLAHGRKMANWEATWRTWMRRAPQMGGAMLPRFGTPAPVLQLIASKRMAK